jgi:hypothetical protein
MVLNWKLLIFSLTAIAVISILFYFGRISLDVGVILSVLSLFVPTVVDYSLKPKVALQIKNLQFIKKSFDHVEGCQLKALIANNGRKICLNLDATLQVKDTQGREPNLLHVNVREINGQRAVESREEPMRDIAYAWTNEKNEITQGLWKELRQKDFVNLLFPYGNTSFGIGSISGSFSSFHSEPLLKIETATDYQVTITIKGEDSEKNTVMKSRKGKIRLS